MIGIFFSPLEHIEQICLNEYFDFWKKQAKVFRFQGKKKGNLKFEKLKSKTLLTSWRGYTFTQLNSHLLILIEGQKMY